MDAIGSMNSLRDDAAVTSRVGKNASARRSDDQESPNGAFDNLLAGLVAPAPQPSIQQDAPKATDLDMTSSVKAANNAAAPNQAESPAQLAAPNNVEAEPSATVGNGTVAAEASAASANDATSPAQVQTQTDGDTLLAQLAALGVNDASQAPSPAANVTTNAATLSASRSNAGVASAQASSATSETSAEVATTPNPALAQTAVVSNDNSSPITAGKVKPIELEAAKQAPGQSLEPVSTTLDGAGSTSIVSGQEVATPANDQANRAPQLTPHTIPMLAATMMRRLESGSKQFTMRLDPPELGQVEVKLTVAADKKVRAVVSADRPEALADLVRSARELTRALQEAGLDLEDNGLTFQMNDPSGGQKQEGRDGNTGRTASPSSNLVSNVETEIRGVSEKTQKSNDPFERWQRARIALTA